MTGQSDLIDLARREVVALHEFFVVWFRAGATVDFHLCEGALAEDFRMVTPDGAVHDRAGVLARLRQARGSQPNRFSIAVSDISVLWQQSDAALLEYVEQQYRDGGTTRRRSTALFTREPAAPRGVLWRHLQETWMQVAEAVQSGVVRPNEKQGGRQ